MNWNVKIMPLIVCDHTGCSDYSKAIRYAVDNGAEVINLSLGTNAVSGYSTSVNDAIDYAYSRNVLIVTAAGNGDVVGGLGYDLNRIPQSPVCNTDQKGNKVIGVGAVDSENKSELEGFVPPDHLNGFRLKDCRNDGVVLFKTILRSRTNKAHSKPGR